MDSRRRGRNFANIPTELLGLILDRLVLLPDFIRFGAVCKQWSLATKQAYNRRICLHQELPMLMVTADDDEKCYSYSIWENKIYLHSIQILYGTKYCGAGYGWLAFVEQNLPPQSTNNNNPSITLLNLFSGTTISLPTIPYYRGPKYYIHKVILSCDPCLYPDDLVVVAILSNRVDCTDKLFSIRSGEDSWKQHRLDKFSHVDDACFYKGKLYVVNREYNHLVAIDFSHHMEEGCPKGINYDISVIKIKIKHPYCNICSWSYLVKSERDLLLVYRIYYIVREEEICEGFRVWKLSESGNNTATATSEWIEIQDLGKFSLFLGDYNESVSIYNSSDVTNFQQNCIYYTDVDADEDLCIYNLATRQISRHNILETSHRYLALCTWISPRANTPFLGLE